VLAVCASDRTNASAQMEHLIADSDLAWALYKSGQGADVERKLRANERVLAPMAEKANLQVAFVLAKLRIRLGEFYVERGDKADSRAARDLLTSALAEMRKINQAIPDSDETVLLLKSGEAALARARAALK